MHILLVNSSVIPALKYGGVERAIWWLGKALVTKGHKVSYLVAKGSYCPFGKIFEFVPGRSFKKQIPAGIDVIQLNCGVNEIPDRPYLVNMQGNTNSQHELDSNTVFVSSNHAARFGSKIFVYNGLDPEDYGKPDLNNKRHYIHFLGDAAWRVKNLRGAIKVASKARMQLHVIGGIRFNFNQGIRFTFSPNVHFYGMKGGAEKNKLINNSRALMFPVRWHEPFGIAIIESLYFGCPVFGTPYGSLPELVTPDVGYLTADSADLANALKDIDRYNRRRCYEYVMENFTSDIMAKNYLKLYERVLNGKTLNQIPPRLLQVQREKFLPFD